LRADNSQVCNLEYYSGGKNNIVLSDEFWAEVENSFKQIDELLKKVRLKNYEEKNIA